MGHDKEAVQVRLGAIAVLSFVFLLGGPKTIVFLSFLCGALFLFGYVLLRFIQENAVSVDEEIEYSDLMLARNDTRKLVA